MLKSLAFFHGFLGASADAAPWRLALTDWTIEAPELGESRDWNSEVVRLERCSETASVLAGYSMGARLALAVALQRLQATRPLGGLILISGSPGPANEQERSLRRVWVETWSRRLRELPMRQFLEAWYAQSLFADETAALIAELICEKLERNRSSAADILQRFSLAEQPNYRDALHQLNVPVLVIAGERDLKYRRIAEDMADRISDCQLHVLPGAGHLPHRSHSQPCSAVIRRFLNHVECQLDQCS